MQAELPAVRSEQPVALIGPAYTFECESVPQLKRIIWDGNPIAYVVWNTDRCGRPMRFPLDTRHVNPDFFSPADKTEWRVLYIGSPSKCPYTDELYRLGTEYPARRICIIERVEADFEQPPFRLLFRIKKYRTPEELPPVGPEDFKVEPFH